MKKEKTSYRPIPFNPRKTAQEKCANDPEFKAAYESYADEFSALEALLAARREAGLSQAEVAHRMGVSQPVLARIESSLGSQKHSPSLHTLRRYANACGMTLELKMVKKADVPA